MSDEKPHEPEHHKLSTFELLLRAYTASARTAREQEEAMKAHALAQAQVEKLSKDASEWMRRDKESTCTLLVGEKPLQRVVVFTRSDYGRIHHTVTEPLR